MSDSGEMSQGQLNALAKQRGFPSYAAWLAWHNKYQAQNTGQGQPKSAQPGNWLENMLGKIPIHPIYLLNKASEALDKAGKK